MFVAGYRDRAGINARACSALGRIERICEDRAVPIAVRLAQIAQIMEQEPILSDDSPAAYTVRAETASC